MIDYEDLSEYEKYFTLCYGYRARIDIVVENMDDKKLHNLLMRTLLGNDLEKQHNGIDEFIKDGKFIHDEARISFEYFAKQKLGIE